MTPSNKG